MSKENHDTLRPRKPVKKLVARAARFTKKSKTAIYEQCVALALAGKSADELRKMFGVDQVDLLSKKAA